MVVVVVVVVVAAVAAAATTAGGASGHKTEQDQAFEGSGFRNLSIRLDRTAKINIVVCGTIQI